MYKLVLNCRGLGDVSRSTSAIKSRGKERMLEFKRARKEAEIREKYEVMAEERAQEG